MRSLVISKVLPISPLEGMHGTVRRQQLFLSALQRLSQGIEFVWFMPRHAIEALGPLARHEAALSSELGVSVRLSPVIAREQRGKNSGRFMGPGRCRHGDQRTSTIRQDQTRLPSY